MSLRRVLAHMSCLLTLSAPAAAQAPITKPITISAPGGAGPFSSLPVKLAVRLDGAARIGSFRARLNGREVTTLFARASSAACQFTACDLIAEVGPADGLLPGRNELRVETGGRDRGFDSRVFSVNLLIPLAKAGADQKVKLKETARLDGRDSAGSGNPGAGPLVFRWSLTRRPTGSQAALTDPGSATPGLAPDLPGTYVAQLVVSDGGFDSAPAAVTVTVDSGARLKALQARVCCGAGGSTFVQVEKDVYSSGDDREINRAGLNIVVLQRSDLKLVDHRVFPTGDGSSFGPIRAFIETRNSSELMIVSSTQSSGAHNAELAAALAGFGGDERIAAIPGDRPLSFIGVKGLKAGRAHLTSHSGRGAAKRAGADVDRFLTLDAANNYTAIQPDFVPFRLRDPQQPNSILVGGRTFNASLPAGAAGGFLLVFMDRDTGPTGEDNYVSVQTYATNQGNVTQSLAAVNQMGSDIQTAISSGDFLYFIASLGEPVFVAPDTVEIKVHNEDIIDKHGYSITINCRGRSAQDIATATTGPLEVGSLKTHILPLVCPADHPIYNGTFTFTRGTSDVKFNFEQTTNEGDWRQTGLPAAISNLGGNPYVFEQLSFGDTYSLVGSNFPGVPAAESSSILTPGTPGGALRGVLGRGTDNYFEPAGSDIALAAPIPYDLFTIAWQAPSPWPQADSPGKQAAYAYLSPLTSCGTDPAHTPPGSQCLDVRASLYPDLSKMFGDWNNVYENALNQQGKYPGDGNGFTASDFEAVRAQLEREYILLREFAKLRSEVTTMQLGIQGNTGLNVDGVASEIKNSLDTDKDPSGQIAVSLLSALFSIVNAAANLIPPPAGPAIAAATGFAGSWFGAVAGLANAENGNPATEIDTEVGTLKDDLSKAWPAVVTATDQFFKLILTDYQKLNAVGVHRCNNIDTLGPNGLCTTDPEWNIGDNNDTITKMANVAERRHFYSRMLPLAYNINLVPAQRGTNLNGVECNPYETPDGPYRAYPYTYATSEYWATFPTRSFPGTSGVTRDSLDYFVFTTTYSNYDKYYYPPNTKNDAVHFFTDNLFKSPGNPLDSTNWDAGALGFNRIEFFSRGPLKQRVACIWDSVSVSK